MTPQFCQTGACTIELLFAHLHHGDPSARPFRWQFVCIGFIPFKTTRCDELDKLAPTKKEVPDGMVRCRAAKLVKRQKVNSRMSCQDVLTVGDDQEPWKIHQMDKKVTESDLHVSASARGDRSGSVNTTLVNLVHSWRQGSSIFVWEQMCEGIVQRVKTNHTSIHAQIHSCHLFHMLWGELMSCTTSFVSCVAALSQTVAQGFWPFVPRRASVATVSTASAASSYLRWFGFLGEVTFPTLTCRASLLQPLAKLLQ